MHLAKRCHTHGFKTIFWMVARQFSVLHLRRLLRPLLRIHREVVLGFSFCPAILLGQARGWNIGYRDFFAKMAESAYQRDSSAQRADWRRRQLRPEGAARQA